jgi:hypothetical protein
MNVTIRDLPVIREGCWQRHGKLRHRIEPTAGTETQHDNKLKTQMGEGLAHRREIPMGLRLWRA